MYQLKISSLNSPMLKKHQGSMLLSIPFQDDMKKSIALSSSSKMHHNTPPSHDQFRKVIKDLEDMVKQQRQKRQHMQQQLKAYKERSLYKQNQFKKILEKIGFTSNLQKSSNIQKMYNNILNNFDKSNQKALEILQKKYQQNCQLMDRRCSQIIKNTQIQINKAKKLTQQDFSKIKNNIQQVLYLTKYLLDQNKNNKKKISILQNQNKILVQQRTFILQDFIFKKKALAKLSIRKQNLKNQNKKFDYNSNCNQIDQKNQDGSETQCTNNNNSNRRRSKTTQLKTYSGKYQNFQIQTIVEDQKQDIFQNSNIKNYIHNKNVPISSFTINKNNNNKNSIYSVNANTAKAINHNSCKYDRNTINRQSRRRVKPVEVDIYTSDFAEKTSIASQSLRVKKSNNNPATFNPTLIKSQNKMTYKRSFKNSPVERYNNKNNNSSTIIPQITPVQYQQTIKHLKLCYQREKKRRMQLGNIVNKLQSQNQSINQILEDCLKNSYKFGNILGNQNAIEALVKSQKLFQVIRDIKKRLSTVQNSSVNYGWFGQNPLIQSQLYQKSDKKDTQDLRQTYAQVIQGQ